MKEVIKDIKALEIGGDPGVEILGLASDSRQVRPGHLFVALRGHGTDGHCFISEAVRRGASAVLCEEVPEELGIPFVRVKDSREAVATAASNYYGRPSERMTIVGITGTNGKTTTAYIIKGILDAAARRGAPEEEPTGSTGLIGTIDYQVGEKIYPALNTTPGSVQFQGLLSSMLDAGITHAVAEVSSHALVQGRVRRTRFRVAVFTNLTHEHLDYHKTMEDYFKAKKRLFTELLDTNGIAVINADDPYGLRLIKELSGSGRRVITYSAQGDADRGDVDIRAVRINCSINGVSFDLEVLGRHCLAVQSPMIGAPNVQNLLAAAGVAYALGLDWEAVDEGIKKTSAVPGRFETVPTGGDFNCLIDYAHTDDALRRLLLSIRELTAGRLIVVFGCGGDRDRDKRPLMGRAVDELSDLMFITSDNPRGEDPKAIINDILQGVKGSDYFVEPDRAKAVFMAISEARPTDTVVIAGKGHEEYQEIKGKRVGFSDRLQAELAIKKKIKGAKGIKGAGGV